MLNIVRLVTIADATLVSSNVPESPPAAWNSGTTYAAGAQVSLFSGPSAALTTATVYQSLQAGNLNKNPATQTAWWREVGVTYKVYDAATTYFEGDRVIDATAHLVYEAATGSTGVPLTDDNTWLLVGPTNRWAMFDATGSTTSEANRQIVTMIAPQNRVDSVSLFNLEAATVRIQSTTSGYDQTYSLVETSGIDDWYSWFFEPVVRRNQLIVTDLPAYLNQVITVTIDNGTSFAVVGAMVVGQTLATGLSLEGAEAGIVDYSRKEVDQWGTYSLVTRTFVKKLTVQAVVDNVDIDRTQRLLEDYRATPTVWIARGDYLSLGLFGFFRNFTTAFSYPTETVVSFDLEGLA